MTQVDWVFGIVLFLHLLATVVWIGGILLLPLVVLPAARKTFGRGAAMWSFMRAFMRRWGVLSSVAILIFFLTGLYIALKDPRYSGILSTANEWSMLLAVKHVLVGLMVAIAIMVAMIGNKQAKLVSAEDSQQSDEYARRQRLHASLSATLFVIGLVVLFVTGLLSAS